MQKILKNNYPIFLKRLREIKEPKSIKKKGLSRFGSLVVVIFTLPKGTNREKLKNFLKKAPCIRLRRSIYAFSQRHSFYKNEPKLVDAHKFVKFLTELQAEVKIISRVIIVNTVSEESLLRETRDRIEKVVYDIISSCKEIYKKACSKEQDYVTLLDRFYRINQPSREGYH